MEVDTEPSAEARELELLERVFLRVGVAESDVQLEKALTRFLPPVLLKAASPSPAVRDKVLELLTHINRRLKNRPEVQLPVEPLLLQFSDAESPPVVVNFSLVYLKQGFPRLPPPEQTKLLPSLLHCLPRSSSNQQQQDSILQLCVPALVHLEWPRDMQKRREVLPPLTDQSDVRKNFLQFLLPYLLLPYGPVQIKPGQSPPPGLSRTLITRLMGGLTPSIDQLEEQKLAILRLLSSEVFIGADVVCHFIAASGDPKSSVSELSERYLRQFSHNLNWESPVLVNQLLSLFLGTTAAPGKKPHPQSPSSMDNVAPASIRVRIRIFPFLLKSTAAANAFPASIQLVFDSLFGPVTNGKLRSFALHFLHHMCKSTTAQKLAVMAPILLTAFNKVIDQPDEESQMRAMAYVGIGLLAKRSPAHFSKDSSHLLRLFSSLSDTTIHRDVLTSVQGTLVTVATTYHGVEGERALLLEAALLENVYSTSPHARLMAAILASSLFPFSHIPSRFVAMVACGDSREDVREAGKKGLILPSEEDKGSGMGSPPVFPAVVAYLHTRATLTLQSDSCYATAAGKLPFAPKIMSAGLHFFSVCLEHSAGVTDEQRATHQTLKPISVYLGKLQGEGREAEEGGGRREADEGGGRREAEEERGGGRGECVNNYLSLLDQSLRPAGDTELHSVAMLSLLQLTAACPSQLSPLLLPRLAWIRGFTGSSQPNVYEPAGRLLGILSGQLGQLEFLGLAEELYQETWNQTLYRQCGAVVCLGHVTGTAVRALGRAGGGDLVAMVTLVKKSLDRLVTLLSAPPTSPLPLLACKALEGACHGGPLPLPNGPPDEPSDRPPDRPAAVEGVELSKRAVIRCLRKILEKGKDARLREHCAVVLGLMGVAETDPTISHSILHALFSVREEKGVELQFTVGEAIVCAAAGRFSTALHDPWNLTEVTGSLPSPDPEVMSWALNTITTDHTPHPLASIRQAACVWCLCLLKHAPTHPHLLRSLGKLQNVFMSLLAESTEVTQEVAARGLGLTYELCDSSTKDVMVQSLVGTLMEGKRMEQKVIGDTEIFQKGELGKVPSGGGLSTYRELCSLASDLNQPDLVYRFMHLANHNALWNSKKGAAFGFSSIASVAREQLTPHLSYLVPRLYRYKYDPNPKIQLAMTSIWSAVVSDSKTAVDQHLRPIFKDLKENLNSHLWRNRQASCMALGDLLVTRLVSEVAEQLLPLWELCLRARDDVKETVRKAAEFACKSLHKVTIKACESSTEGPKVIGEVLPLLLNKMQNPSGEVRATSLLAILKIVDHAGALMKPYIPQLVPTLLESLSSLEPQELNTLTLRLTGEEEAQEKLDSIRVAASKSSPMMESIRLCIPHIDSEVLVALVPRIVEVLKSGVGLGTKTAAAQLVISLVQHSRDDLTPHAGKLLTTLTSGLLDRSAGVRKTNARAIGHLVRVSKSASNKKLMDKMKTWYFEKNDPTVYSSLAQVVHYISNHASDTAQTMASQLLPLVFIAMHATPLPEDPISVAAHKMWVGSWQDLAPAETAAMKLYLSELVGVANHALQSQSWLIKAQGAAALATVAEKMGLALPPQHLSTILNVLLEGLQARTWEGKESLLKALKTVCTKNKATLLTPDTNRPPSSPPLPSPHTITTALLAQCMKKQNNYRVVAMETIGGVASSLQVGILSELVEIALPLLTPKGLGGAGSGSEEEEEGEERRAASERRILLREKTAEAVGKVWPVAAGASQAAHFSCLLLVLSSSLPLATRALQLAILTALTEIFSRLSAVHLSEEDVACISSKTIPAVCKCAENIKYSIVRQKAVDVLDKLISHLHNVNLVASLPPSTVSEIQGCLEAIQAPKDKGQISAILSLLHPPMVPS